MRLFYIPFWHLFSLYVLSPQSCIPSTRPSFFRPPVLSSPFLNSTSLRQLGGFHPLSRLFLQFVRCNQVEPPDLCSPTLLSNPFSNPAFRSPLSILNPVLTPFGLLSQWVQCDRCNERNHQFSYAAIKPLFKPCFPEAFFHP
jgi:hypothetical protein